MRWKNLKTWQKGLIIGAMPLVLTITASGVFIINPPSGIVLMIALSFFPFFYLFSFFFLTLGVFIGFALGKTWKVKLLIFFDISSYSHWFAFLWIFGQATSWRSRDL